MKIHQDTSSINVGMVACMYNVCMYVCMYVYMYVCLSAAMYT